MVASHPFTFKDVTYSFVNCAPHDGIVDKQLKGYKKVISGEYVVFKISDQGMGISPKDINRVFEPFYTKKVIDCLKNNTYDLLLLDMIMDHEMDGLETYKKAIEYHPGQKTILTSGFSETFRVKEAQRLGAGMYIKKPYQIENLGYAVKTELERR